MTDDEIDEAMEGLAWGDKYELRRAAYTAGYRAGIAAERARLPPLECLCGGVRKTLTTNAGTWHICERCSAAYFLSYAYAARAALKE